MSFLERYLRGEHEQVWADLRELGPKVRDEAHAADAQSVAEETMRRVRNNVEVLRVRLGEVGYRFKEPDQVHVPPSATATAELDDFEHPHGPLRFKCGRRAWPGALPEWAVMVIVITGVMAAGKSTVAQRLAERLPRSAHVRGDTFRRMIVSGAEDLLPEATPAAVEQLWLRYRLSAATADAYAAAGFTAVVQDVILGSDLPSYLDLVATRPRHLFVLAPAAETVERRKRHRAKPRLRRVGRCAARPVAPGLRRHSGNSAHTPGRTRSSAI